MWNIREKTAKKNLEKIEELFMVHACKDAKIHSSTVCLHTMGPEHLWSFIWFFFNTFRWLHEIFSWYFVEKILNLIKSWKLKCNFKKTLSPLCYILIWKANILVYVLICCNVFTPLCKVSKRQNHYFNDFFLLFSKTFLLTFLFLFFIKLLLNWWKETNKLQHNSDFFSHFFRTFFSRQIVLW